MEIYAEAVMDWLILAIICAVGYAIIEAIRACAVVYLKCWKRQQAVNMAIIAELERQNEMRVCGRN